MIYYIPFLSLLWFIPKRAAFLEGGAGRILRRYTNSLLEIHTLYSFPLSQAKHTEHTHTRFLAIRNPHIYLHLWGLSFLPSVLRLGEAETSIFP